MSICPPLGLGARRTCTPPATIHRQVSKDRRKRRGLVARLSPADRDRLSGVMTVLTGDDAEYVENEFDTALYENIVAAASEYRYSSAYSNLTKPSREYFDQAMRAIKVREAQQFRFSQMDCESIWIEHLRLGNFTVPGEPSLKTKSIINAIRAKHPTQFTYGARCGFYCSAHDANLFRHWTGDEREAFFVGYIFGRNERLRLPFHAEAAE